MPATAPPRVPRARGLAAAPHEVRIVGGRWRRHKLPVPDLPGLRPTPDRVRETLFNWLGQDLAGWHCLDAFAGSGALGLECASRGAAAVVLLESHAGQARSLRASAAALGATGVTVACAEALAWMRAAPAASFDLILLDPPFGAGLVDAALAAAVRLLAPQGWIYLEAEARAPAELLLRLGLAEHRFLRAGASHAHLLLRAEASAA